MYNAPSVKIGRFTITPKIDMSGLFLIDDQGNYLTITFETFTQICVKMVNFGEEFIKESLEQTFINADIAKIFVAQKN